MRTLALFASLLLVLLASTTANAAQFQIEQARPSKRCPYFAFVYINGGIEPSDDEKFLNVTQNIPAGCANIYLNSEGGSVVPGLHIGLRIKQYEWGTFVDARTICASACGLIWLAGDPRMATSNSFIGFHAAYNKSDRRESGAANALVGSYLEKLGFGWETVIYLTKTAPQEMEWLDSAKAKKYGIDFSEIKSKNIEETEATIPTVFLIKIVLLAGMIIFVGRWFYGKGRRPGKRWMLGGGGLIVANGAGKPAPLPTTLPTWALRMKLNRFVSLPNFMVIFLATLFGPRFGVVVLGPNAGSDVTSFIVVLLITAVVTCILVLLVGIKWKVDPFAAVAPVGGVVGIACSQGSPAALQIGGILLAVTAVAGLLGLGLYRRHGANVDVNRLEYAQVPLTTAAHADTTSRPAANKVGHGTPDGGSNQILSELAAVKDDPVNTVQQSALKTVGSLFLITVAVLALAILFALWVTPN